MRTIYLLRSTLKGYFQKEIKLYSIFCIAYTGIGDVYDNARRHRNKQIEYWYNKHG